MEVICASAQRRSRQEMREAAQSWEVRVCGTGGQCVLQQVVDTRQEEKGGCVVGTINPIHQEFADGTRER